MISRPLGLVLAVTSAMLLAGCGGGGSSSSIPSGGGGGGTAPHAALRAGFSGIGRGGSAAQRHTLALAGSLVPIADFVTPDSYVKSIQPSIGATAIAYYDPSAGAVPNPLPTVTWSASGIPVMLGKPQVPVTMTGVSIVGESFFNAPSVIGQGTIVGTASNSDTVTLTYNNYRGGGISTLDPAGPYGYGLSPCITFAASVSTGGTSGDLCLTKNADGTSQVVAARGAVLVTKPIDQVSASDAASVPTTATTIPTVQIIPGAGTYTIIAHTAAGALVKWEPVLNAGTDTLSGKITDEYGPYRMGNGTAGAWDY